MRSVYRQGRLSAEQRGLRARIDAALLAVENLAALARVVGLDREVLSRARARAKAAPRRVFIRLKHSLAEGEEIHAVLPDTMEEIQPLARIRGTSERRKSRGPEEEDK
jgi:hypothetical protein